MKKGISLLLAIVMLVSMGSVAVFAEPAVVGLTVGGKYTVAVPLGEAAVGVFTPTNDGYYLIESVGDDDVVVVLMNESGDILTYDDDNGANANFLLSAYLQKGETYYYGIAYYDPETMSGNVTFGFYDSNDGNVMGHPTLESDQPTHTAYCPLQKTVRYAFNPLYNARYAIESKGNGDTAVELRDSLGNLIDSDDDTGSGDNFRLAAYLEAGKTYYYDIGYYYYEEDFGNIEFDLYTMRYPDVTINAWYYDAVNFVSEAGIMTGYNSGYFGPAHNLQRQDLVVMLARMANVDLTLYQGQTGGLSDVKAGDYYAPSVAWAVEQGIITGYDDGTFGVGDSITREQVATILYRANGSPVVDNVAETLDVFPDDVHVSGFAKTAMAWAVQNGIISGMQNGRLSPVSGASRAQIATIFTRIMDAPIIM